MKVHNVAQGSVDWAILRSGIPTASEFGNLVTDGLEVRKGEMPRTYIAKKLAEWWTGGPLAEFNSFDMEQGNILEQEAIPFLNLTLGCCPQIERPGFLLADDEQIGCSPDGIAQECGWEIKCPRIETHIRYLLAGTVPKEYLPQIHASLFVTGWGWWNFVSYRRRLPMLRIEVARDGEAQTNIEEALEAFWYHFELGKKRLCELNGGPPKRFARAAGVESADLGRRREPEYVDIIP